MEVTDRDQSPDAAVRRPSGLDLCASALLLTTVVLHVVAMFPRYFGGNIGQGSVASQPDQAALYAVVAAGWALALALVLSGPARVRLGAGVAVGLALTELGFRVADVGEALQSGVGSSSTGVWLMTAGWLTGVAGALVAVLAARHRARIEGADAAAIDPIAESAPSPVAMAAPEAPTPSPPVPSWVPQPDPQWAAPGPARPPADPGWRGPAAAQAPADPGGRGPAATQPPAGPQWAAPPSPESQWAPPPPEPQWAELSPERQWAPPPPEPRPSIDPTSANPWAPGHQAAAAAGPDEGDAASGGLRAPVEPTAPLPVEPTAPLPVGPGLAGPPDATTPFRNDAASGGPVDATGAVPAAGTAPAGPYGAGLTALVALLALITAGAFLPAWDRYVGLVTTTGRTVTFSLGNAFSGPWTTVLGNVLVALALVAVPILASRLGDRTVAAAVVVGSLLVLASQFTAAIVQVNQPVPPSVAGLTPSQAAQLGLQLHLSLTGWFTLDVLAAYGLFVAVMVIGYLRPAPAPENSPHENSVGTWPTAPEARSPASLPWS